MIMGLIVYVLMIPFRAFIELNGLVINSLGFNFVIEKPIEFNETMLWIFEKIFFFDPIVPVATLIHFFTLSIYIWIAIQVFEVLVWTYGKIKGI